ncbi:hypothetical protein [Eisenibacter elegans]|uniref:hypothetical protein n=1 Tax=Eisenibacter elegans TaxID=997 RepID=UPI000404D7D5|nr:hypothetical protein [Eisenibacter elegans]
MNEQHQQFFEKALAIQAQRQEKLTEAEKKEIALQLGFSEADWQAVLASFEAHWERGAEFLKRLNYEKAIIELEDALIIQPEHAGTLAALAQAYLGEFQSKKRKNLKEKALQYAQECLRYSPKNQEAHQVIDFFNPNQIRPYTPAQPKARINPPSTQKKEKNPLRHIGTIIWGGMGFVVLFGLYLEFVKPNHKKYISKSTQKKNQTQQSAQQSGKSSYTAKYESPLAFEIAALPQDLAAKYQITQKDSITWQVSSLSKTPLLELKLVENKWWYPDYADKSKPRSYYADLTLELKTLCDSIRFDALIFAFQVFDKQGQTLHQEDSLYIEQRFSYDRFMNIPKDYFFQKGESNNLYFRHTSKETDVQDSSLSPKKIALHLQTLQTAPPPKYKEKAVKIKNAPQDIDIFELKEGFMEDPGSPYSIHFWALKIRNNHAKRAVKAMFMSIRYYDKDKQLITEGGDYLIHNLTEPLAAGSENVYKIRTNLGENIYKNPPVVVLPKDIAYKEVAFSVLEWER